MIFIVKIFRQLNFISISVLSMIANITFFIPLSISSALSYVLLHYKRLSTRGLAKVHLLFQSCTSNNMDGVCWPLCMYRGNIVFMWPTPTSAHCRLLLYFSKSKRSEQEIWLWYNLKNINYKKNESYWKSMFFEYFKINE